MRRKEKGGEREREGERDRGFSLRLYAVSPLEKKRKSQAGEI